MLCPWAMSFFQKLCTAPFPPVSCSFPEPTPGPQCGLYNLLEGQPENSWPLGDKCCIISNPSRYPGLYLPCFLQHEQQQHFSVDPLGWVTGTQCLLMSVGGIRSRAIGLPGTMFATLGVSTKGPLGPNPYHPSPKVTNTPPIKSPLHFYETSGLLPLVNFFLSHLLTPTTKTLPPL